jgi:hypoxanthine phosphoribosyltransferase
LEAVAFRGSGCQNAGIPRKNHMPIWAVAVASGKTLDAGARRGERMSEAVSHLQRERMGKDQTRDGEIAPVQPYRRENGPGHGPHEVRQERLPPLRWLLQPDVDRFAHPIEIQFAQLLTFYGVRWAYEPTTFAVRWGSDGRPEEFVTPDFYLPDHDLYIELTTMRQRLVTRKNRKFRLLRESYPNVRVRLLYLRDCERLQDAYAPANGRPARVGSMLIDGNDIEARVADLARELIAVWSGLDAWDGPAPLLLGLGSGSERFLALLGDRIRDRGCLVDVDRADLTAYSAPRGAMRVRLSRSPVKAISGRPVVIVQEVLSTGLSAAYLDGWLRRHGAESVGVCALLDREPARILDVPVLCRGFEAPDVSLAGFGLTRWREFRDLPFIAELET